MNGRRGKVVYHLRKGGDLKQEMKHEYSVGLYVMTKSRAPRTEPRGTPQRQVAYVGTRNRYCN